MAVILDDEVRFSLKSEQKKSDDNQVGYEGSVKPSILQPSILQPSILQ
ncbi:MAG: hypothetical protein HAW66_09235, partial [Shewanella sp.]|nr:hypothetical protein [Shewanella sp.]